MLRESILAFWGELAYNVLDKRSIMAFILLLVIYITFISLGLPDSLFGVTWPVMHIDFHLHVGYASLVSVIIGLGTVSTSFFAGKLIRKFGTGMVTTVSILFTVIGLLGISYSPNIYFVILFAIVLGIGAGAIDAALNDYVAKNYKPQHMNWLHSFWGIGVTVSPIIMSRFLLSDNWRGGYRTIALIQLAIFVIVVIAFPLWKKISSKSVNEVAVASDNEKQKFRPTKVRGLSLVLVALACYCGIEMVVGVWGATFLIKTRGASPSTAALWVSLYYGGVTAGRILSGFLAMKLSDKTLIRYGMAVVICGAICLALPFSKNIALIGMLLVGLGCAPIFPSTIHATKDRFDSAFSADIVGFQMASAYIGGGLIQPLFGVIAARTTFAILPYVLMGLMLIQIILIETLNRKLRKTA